jgi:hypothetical protein
MSLSYLSTFFVHSYMSEHPSFLHVTINVMTHKLFTTYLIYTVAIGDIATASWWHTYDLYVYC